MTPGLPRLRNVQTRHPQRKDGTNEITAARIPPDRQAGSDDLPTRTVVSGMATARLTGGQGYGANRAVKCRSWLGWETMRMPGSLAARLATRVATSMT